MIKAKTYYEVYCDRCGECAIVIGEYGQYDTPKVFEAQNDATEEAKENGLLEGDKIYCSGCIRLDVKDKQNSTNE